MINIVVTKDSCLIETKGLELILTSEITSKRYPLILIRSITINESTSFTGKILRKCSEYGIHFSLETEGISIGSWSHKVSGPQMQLVYKQMNYISSQEAQETVAKWLQLKTEGRLKFLSKAGGQGSSTRKYSKKAHSVFMNNSSISISKILSQEGSLSKMYYAAINEILPEGVRFKKRTRQPASDLFNAALNYSLSVLYRIVESSLAASGLDPYLGINHSIERGGKAMVYDMIEPFRPWVEEIVVIYLSSPYKGKTYAITEEDNQGIRLAKEDKVNLIQILHNALQEKIIFQNKKMTKQNHIYHEGKKLRKCIKNFN